MTETIHRFRSCGCKSSEKSLKMLKCYVKTYGKKLSTLNGSIEKIRKLGDDFMVKIFNFQFKIIIIK